MEAAGELRSVNDGGVFRFYVAGGTPVAGPVAENIGLHLSANVVDGVPYRDDSLGSFDMSLKQDIRAVLLQQPGLSSTEITRCHGKDRNNVRKAAQVMEAAGELRSVNDGGVFRLYVAGGTPVAGPVAENIGLHLSANVVDGVPYRDVTEHSTSRTLVPVSPTL
jgi:hypothetical protein